MAKITRYEYTPQPSLDGEYSDTLHPTATKELPDLLGITVTVPVVMEAKIVGNTLSLLTTDWIFESGILKAITPGKWS